ncbi:hypothetical protein [Nocardia sp. NRRL S-836]|uniref:hypothetical protein n=1 Tax=Nocardia sp. NRRL S-836 TaxID=1519492 RepID=UPI0006B0165C|nr:hypothetical protein [Nocardia sp. NRRL S-836]KOV87585.1 hypothetical protein ADL03_06740 [Nocardia sp. NRRL S-836]
MTKWNKREIALSITAIVLFVATLVFTIIQPLSALAIPPVLYAIAKLIQAIRGDGGKGTPA